MQQQDGWCENPANVVQEQGESSSRGTAAVAMVHLVSWRNRVEVGKKKAAMQGKSKTGRSWCKVSNSSSSFIGHIYGGNVNISAVRS